VNTDSLGPVVEMDGSSHILPADVRRVANVAANEPIEVSVYLKPRSMPDFSNDGRSLAERRAALSAIRAEEHDGDIRLLREFATAHHLTVGDVEPARRLVKLSGTAASMQAAFQIKLGIYRGGERFRSYAGPIRIPARVESVVQAILGLDTRPAARPHFIIGDTVAQHRPNEVGQFYGFPTAGNGTGECIAILEFSRTNRPAPGDAGYSILDIGAAFSAMNLPTPTIVNVSVDGRVKNNPGFTFTMTVSEVTAGAVVTGGKLVRLTVNDTSQASNDDLVVVSGVDGIFAPHQINIVDDTHIDLQGTLWFQDQSVSGTAVDVNNADGEVNLDIQVAGGVAPGARLAVYFAPLNEMGFADAISKAAADRINNPSVISISWGLPEETWTRMGRLAVDGALADAAVIGVCTFVASGDDLSMDQIDDGKVHVDFPASSPYAIGCGGTKIDTSGSAITSEVVWNEGTSGTGGGISSFYPIPDFQAGVDLPLNVSTRKVGRGVPDVAGNASPGSGYKIYYTSNRAGISPWHNLGGTSAVAPLWAGLTALLNEAAGTPNGFFLRTLYQNPELMNAITTKGNNCPSSNPTLGYSTGPGWSACTGWGVPIGYAFYTRLVGLRPFGMVATFTVPSATAVMVLSRNPSGHILQMLNWWSGGWALNDLISAKPTPALAQGTPCAAMLTWSGHIQMHVVYRDVNNHISDIWGQAPTPASYQDLSTVQANVPAAQSDPCLVSSPSLLHVLYRDSKNHIAHLSYNFPSSAPMWQYTDLTTSAPFSEGAPGPFSRGAPCGVVFSNQLNVFWRDQNNHISSLGVLGYQDLNARYPNLPLPNGDPYSFTVVSTTEMMHVLYRDAGNHISARYATATTGWGYWNLNVVAQDALAQGNPCAVVSPSPFGANNQVHVVYRDVNNHISHFYEAEGTFPVGASYEDLNTVVPNAPAAKGDPFCYISSAILMLVVTYVDINDHIAFLYNIYGQPWVYIDLGQGPRSA
jgi:hypothetical protein